MREEDVFRFDFWPDGTFRQMGREGWREALCSVCHEPIRWVLDMMSFRHDPPGFTLAHARCVWLPEAFEREARASSRLNASALND